MEIKRIETGYLKENCYIIKKEDYILVVDPGDDFELINDEIAGGEVLGILITHHHFDHVGALDKLRKSTSALIYDYNTCDEIKYSVGPFQFDVIRFPGHAKDLVGFYFEQDKIMFVGDFVFKQTVGRCDLDGGNFNEMLNSIAKLKKYPEDIKLYPGHGPITTLKDEIDTNPYF